jgi:hypothetical protein
MLQQVLQLAAQNTNPGIGVVRLAQGSFVVENLPDKIGFDVHFSSQEATEVAFFQQG